MKSAFAGHAANGMDVSCDLTASCTEQLWGMPPMLEGPWMDVKARDLSRMHAELQFKNIELSREHGLLLMQMHITREELQRAREEKQELESLLEAAVRDMKAVREGMGQELQELRVQLALLRREREEREEQELLAKEIWGPTLRQPDSSWDPLPVLLYSRGSKDDTETQPLTVGKVASDMGFKCGARDVHRLGSHVRDAFMRAHGRAPDLHVFYTKDGTPDRVACFTERDRDLIARVVRKHGVPDVD